MNILLPGANNYGPCGVELLKLSSDIRHDMKADAGAWLKLIQYLHPAAHS